LFGFAYSNNISPSKFTTAKAGSQIDVGAGFFPCCHNSWFMAQND